MLAGRLIECPYFGPAQIAFLERHRFDVALIIADNAERVSFHFEGGDGEVIARLVQSGFWGTNVSPKTKRAA